MATDPIRAALERWYWLLETELLCLDNPAETDWGAVASVAAQTRAVLATPPAMDGPADLPEGFIDPEHKGEALELLQTFYQACRSEGGTADEINLRGLRAVLAAAAPSTTPPPAPMEEEGEGPSVAEIDAAYLATWCEESGRYDILAFARAILSRWGRPAAPPTRVEGEGEELADWLQYAADLRRDGKHFVPLFALNRVVTLLQSAATELATLRSGVASSPVAKPEAWLYPGDPLFDGNKWHVEWEATTSEQVARWKSQPRSPIPLFRQSADEIETPQGGEVEG